MVALTAKIIWLLRNLQLDSINVTLIVDVKENLMKNLMLHMWLVKIQ